MTLLRRTLSLALLLPGVVLTYSGLALCGLAMLVEPDGSEE